ncbi:MAG: MobB mobilization protein [Synergistaceae bacterium]|jgi:cytochrome c553|nr:MobB mobilization protein [Synergistaceae bacterium]
MRQNGGTKSSKKRNTEHRTRRVSFRLSEPEHARVSEYISLCGLTLSELARKGILNQRAIPKTDLAILAELRRLGGLLKHIHNESRGAYSALTAQAIRDLSAYARALSEKHANSSHNSGEPHP